MKEATSLWNKVHNYYSHLTALPNKHCDCFIRVTDCSIKVSRSFMTNKVWGRGGTYPLCPPWIYPWCGTLPMVDWTYNIMWWKFVITISQGELFVHLHYLSQFSMNIQPYHNQTCKSPIALHWHRWFFGQAMHYMSSYRLHDKLQLHWKLHTTYQAMHYMASYTLHLTAYPATFIATQLYTHCMSC